MTNPTSNFGWQMPTSTDLVTDLPADFEVFGQAVDTSLADLKGGTTNQVLAKNSNTDMDFKWVADAAGMTNPMTTTGDIIYSSPGSTPVRLGIGTANQVLAVSGGVPAWTTVSTGATFSGAVITQGSAQTIPNGTSTTINFDTEILDVGGYHDNATNNSRLTIPAGKTGYVLLHGKVNMTANSTGASEAFIMKNGGAISGNTYKNTASFYASPMVTIISSCVPGDYFQIGMYQDSGGNLNTISGQTFTTLMITFLGA